MFRLFTLLALSGMTSIVVACSGGVSSTSGAGGATASSVAASSSGSTIATGSSGGGQAGTTASSVASASSAVSSSSSTSTASGGDCYTQCEVANPSEFLKLGLLLLTDCGCAASAACANDCAPYCANGQPSGAPPDGSPCRVCLFAEGSKKAGSVCATEAGAACLQDPSCAKFVTCAIGCP